MSDAPEDAIGGIYFVTEPAAKTIATSVGLTIGSAIVSAMSFAEASLWFHLLWWVPTFGFCAFTVSLILYEKREVLAHWNEHRSGPAMAEEMSWLP